MRMGNRSSSNSSWLCMPSCGVSTLLCRQVFILSYPFKSIFCMLLPAGISKQQQSPKTKIMLLTDFQYCICTYTRNALSTNC